MLRGIIDAHCDAKLGLGMNMLHRQLYHELIVGTAGTLRHGCDNMDLIECITTAWQQMPPGIFRHAWLVTGLVEEEELQSVNPTGVDNPALTDNDIAAYLGPFSESSTTLDVEQTDALPIKKFFWQVRVDDSRWSVLPLVLWSPIERRLSNFQHKSALNENPKTKSTILIRACSDRELSPKQYHKWSAVQDYVKFWRHHFAAVVFIFLHSCASQLCAICTGARIYIYIYI